MELVTQLGGYAGAIVTIVGLIVMVFKPIRNKFVEFVTKISGKDKTAEQLDKILTSVNDLTAQNQIQSEALVSVIRNTIMHLYYKYRNADTISAYERENIEKLFAAYQALGGNSFVAECVEEIRNIQIGN